MGKHVINHNRQPHQHARHSPLPGGSAPEQAQQHGRHQCSSGQRKRRRHHGQYARRAQRRHGCRQHGHGQQGEFGQDHPLLRHGTAPCVGVHHVAHQCVADRQQQAVRRGQSCCQAPSRHQARHHIRHAAQFGRGQHHQVCPQADFAQLQNAVAVDVADRQQRRVHLAPLTHPCWQGIKGAADQVVHDFKLHQQGQRGHTEVQQCNKKQRPRHRRARLCHAGHGEITGQQVGQTGGAHHQTEHQGQKVAPRVLEQGLFFRCAMGVAVKGLAVLGQTTQGAGAFTALLHRAGPALAGAGSVLGQRGQFSAGRNDQCHVGVLRPQLVDTCLRPGALLLQCRVHVQQALLVHTCAALKFGGHFLFCGVVAQPVFQHRHLVDLLAVHHRCQRVAQLFVGQPGHRNQKCQQQHHVLGHLRPGDGPHAAQEGAQQHPTQPQHDADLELHPGQP